MWARIKNRSRFLAGSLAAALPALALGGWLAVSCGGGGRGGVVVAPAPPERDTTPPTAPTGLRAAVADSTVILRWTPNDEADLKGYFVFFSPTHSEPVRMSRRNAEPVAAPAFEIAGLDNGVAYHFAVKSVDLNGNMSFFSSVVTATPRDPESDPPPTDPPAPPTALGLEAGVGSLTLTWTPSPAAVEYFVYRGLSYPGPYTLAAVVDQAPRLDAGLDPGVTYFYLVKSVSAQGLISSPSTIVSARPQSPPVPPPSAPTGLTALGGDGAVSLTWDADPDAELLGYEVYFGAAPDALALATSAPVPEPGYSMDSLVNGTTYYFAVSAVDRSNAESALSQIVSATPEADAPPAVEPPTNLSVAPGQASLTLSWLASPTPGVDAYFVYRGFSASGPFALVASASTSPYTDRGLDENRTYYYVVKAGIGDQALSESSNVASGRPEPGDAEPPSAPTGLAAQPGAAAVTLSWNPNPEPDLDGYIVYSGTASDQLEPAAGPVAQNAFTVTPLVNGTVYYFAVRAVDRSGNPSPFSAVATAAPQAQEPPPPDPPDPPTGLEAEPGDRLAALAWNLSPAPDLVGYNVYRLLQADGQRLRLNGSLVVGEAYTATGLVNDVEYAFAVTAVIQGGIESGRSDPVTATPFYQDLTPPDPPSGLVGTPMDRAAFLSWSANAEPDLAGYNLWRGQDPGMQAPVPVETLGPGRTWTTVPDLTNDTAFHFALTAFDASGNESGFSNTATVTPASDDLRPPPVPTGLEAEAGDGRVVLVWDAVAAPDLAGYRVYRTSVQPFDAANLAPLSGLVAETGYADEGAVNGVTYYYAVTAEDSFGNESDYSVAATATPAAHADWPRFKGSARNSGVAQGPLSVPLSDVPTWTLETAGEFVGSPAVYDGVLFAGNTLGMFYALDARTGSLLWQRAISSSWLAASPAVADDGVYVGTYGGEFLKLDRATGATLWSWSPGDGVQFISSPVLDHEKAYFGGSDGRVYALARLDGEVVWSFATGNQVWSSPALWGGRVYIGSADRRVYALDAATGALEWSFAAGEKVFSSPLAAGGFIYIGSLDGRVYKLDAATGGLEWSFTADTGVDSTPTLYQGRVFFGSGSVYLGGNRGSFYSVSDADGSLLERRSYPAYFEASPVAAGGLVWIGAWNGVLFGFEPDNLAGGPAFSYRTGAEVHAPVAVAVGMLFLASRDGNIYAFGP